MISSDIYHSGIPQKGYEIAMSFIYISSMDPKFITLDVETTGFSPKRGDRIVEIGLVTSTYDGEIIDKFETLINPNRDVSASHIHGITASMVQDAPTIDQVLDDIGQRLEGNTIVGHNLPFDLRFLNHEFSRHLSKDIRLEGICTLALSKYLSDYFPSRKLEALCRYFDIELDNAHSALSDTISTHSLFHQLKTTLEQDHGPSYFKNQFVNPVLLGQNFRPKGIVITRPSAQMKIEEKNSRILDYLTRLPQRDITDAKVNEYLELLDRVLEDRIVTEDEIEDLYEFALETGLTKSQAEEIHEQYFKDLCTVYWSDAVLSDWEKNDLNLVATLLNVEIERAHEIVERIISSAPDANEKKDSRTDLTGLTICITGQLNAKIDGVSVDRKTALNYAVQRGMIPKSSVSKKLDYLVTSDPNSMSGKAKKARELGVRIISEPSFWNLLGVPSR